MMDLRVPFSNQITYGKKSTVGFIDILETYCYFKGLPIHRRLRFDLNGQVYRVVRSGTRAVVFRNVTEEEDTSALLQILADDRMKGITQLDVNYDANQEVLLENSETLKHVKFIKTSDFDTGTVWDSVDTD